MTSVIVTCNDVDATWELPPDHLSLLDSVDIWRIRLESDPSMLADMESLLDEEEISKSYRFRQAKDKHRFVTRKAALRLILSRYLRIDAKSILFITGRNKKPGLKPINSSAIHFNVSHSGNWVLISISNLESGVDLEQTSTGFDYHTILNDSFSGPEIEHIKNNKNPGNSFFRLWTRKEALTKATSKGLDDDFAAIPSLDGNHTVDSDLLWSERNWTVSTFEVDESHTGSIASSPAKSFRFFDFVTNQ